MSYYDINSSFGQYLANNPSQMNGWDYITHFLDSIGLGSLTQWAQDLLVEFGTSLTDEQFTQRIRETEPYKIRFNANEKRKKAGLPPLPESQILELESAYRQNRQAIGLPAYAYDQPSDFEDLIAAGVSPKEDEERLLGRYQQAKNADPAVKAKLQEFFGLTEGDFLAYYTDPARTMDRLTREFNAAQVAGAAQRSGYGDINLSQADRLTALGVTDAQARQGFGQLAGQSELFSSLPGQQGQEDITREDQLAATFAGDANAQKKVVKKAKERVGEFDQGGGYTQTQYGTSVGSAQ